MKVKSCLQDVEKILELILEHSADIKNIGKPTLTKLERWCNWLSTSGSFTFAVGVIAYLSLSRSQVSSPWLTVAFSLRVIGFLVFLISIVLMVVYLVKTTKAALAEHLRRLSGRLPLEMRLLGRLIEFDSFSLEFAERRFGIELSKVLSRLDLIGGDSLLKPSAMGIGVILVGIVASYLQLDFANLSFAVFGILGLALTAGFSIGAWQMKSGARQADYYAELLSLAIHMREKTVVSATPFPWTEKSRRTPLLQHQSWRYRSKFGLLTLSC